MAGVAINKKLNLVIPIERADGSQLFVYSIPIARAVMDRYYLPLGQAFNKIHVGGLGIIAGSRLAYNVLKDVSEIQQIWTGQDGVEAGVINEIMRGTQVFAPGKTGWDMIPLDQAVSANLIDPEDMEAARNALVFFTLASYLMSKAELPVFMSLALQIWGGQLVSSNVTEFRASLPTLNGTDNSGAKPATATS